MIFRTVLVMFISCYLVKGDNFPSLLASNATLVIVIDREYLADQYESIRLKIEDYMVYAKREILRHGGVNILYFSWTAINVKRDITAILSVASCEDTWRLFRASQSENLLHMAISEADCPRLPPNEAVTVPIIEKGQETPQILLDLRTARIYKWKHVTYFYPDISKKHIPFTHSLILTKTSDSLFIMSLIGVDNIHYYEKSDKDLLTRVIKSITKQANHVEASGISLIKINSNFSKSSIEDVRWSLRNKLSTIDPKVVGGNFLVICSYDLVEHIMEYAKQFKLVDIKNQWLYLISNTDGRLAGVDRLKFFLKEGDNVGFIFNNSIINGFCEGGISCHIEKILEGFTNALDNAILDEYEMAATVSEEEWEAIRPTKIERRNFLLEKVKKHLKNFGTCDNCTTWKMQTGETWGREYQIKNNDRQDASMAAIFTVGTWRPSDGPTMTDELFPHVAHGFRGKSLPFVSFHNPPWQILKLNESGDVQQLGGLVFDIIKELSNTLNFTYTVEMVKTENKQIRVSNYSANPNINKSREFFAAFGEDFELTTFNLPKSILEKVHNKTVAMGACAFTITDDNKKLINFTIPISIQRYTFLVARPKELSRALLFTAPFTGDTWVCLSATIMAMGPVLYYIHKFSPVYEYKGIRSSKGGLSTIQNCIWYMYGALLQQGGMHLPYADSARIIVGTWWLVVLVIGTTYCGNLVAFLTFPKIDVPIKTVDELVAKRETISWSIAKNTFLESQLKITNEDKYKIINDRQIDIKEKEEMIELIRAGKHVFLDWKIKLQYVMKQQFLDSDACDFALGTDEFSDEKIALIVAPDTPYLTRINEEIKKLHQVGLIQKWLDDYLPKKDRCWKKKRSIEVNNHTVNMDDMQGSFFILLFGFVLALTIITIEKLWFKKSSKSETKIIQPFIS